MENLLVKKALDLNSDAPFPSPRLQALAKALKLHAEAAEAFYHLHKDVGRLMAKEEGTKNDGGPELELRVKLREAYLRPILQENDRVSRRLIQELSGESVSERVILLFQFMVYELLDEGVMDSEIRDELYCLEDRIEEEMAVA